jgi:hypothetical protein
MTTSIPPHWKPAPEAAADAKYSAEHVRRLARQGRIVAAKHQGGREWYVDLEDLLRYKAEQEEKGRGQ